MYWYTFQSTEKQLLSSPGWAINIIYLIFKNRLHTDSWHAIINILHQYYEARAPVWACAAAGHPARTAMGGVWRSPALRRLRHSVPRMSSGTHAELLQHMCVWYTDMNSLVGKSGGQPFAWPIDRTGPVTKTGWLFYDIFVTDLHILQSYMTLMLRTCTWEQCHCNTCMRIVTLS